MNGDYCHRIRYSGIGGLVVALLLSGGALAATVGEGPLAPKTTGLGVATLNTDDNQKREIALAWVEPGEGGGHAKMKLLYNVSEKCEVERVGPVLEIVKCDKPVIGAALAASLIDKDKNPDLLFAWLTNDGKKVE
jgi:hypothetical protein